MACKYKLSEKKAAFRQCGAPSNPSVAKKECGSPWKQDVLGLSPMCIVPWGLGRVEDYGGLALGLLGDQISASHNGGCHTVGCSQGPTVTKFYSEMEQTFCVV